MLQTSRVAFAGLESTACDWVTFTAPRSMMQTPVHGSLEVLIACAANPVSEGP